jgi:hypothetical protein
MLASCFFACPGSVQCSDIYHLIPIALREDVSPHKIADVSYDDVQVLSIFSRDSREAP